MPLIQTFDYHGKPMHIAKDRIVAIIQSDKMKDNQRLTQLEIACGTGTETWMVCEPCHDFLKKFNEA